ncbi:MAG: RNB domain-containing ribonuclease [Bilophila wadsworthia]
MARSSRRKAPFPYRIHPAPDPDRLSTLFRTLASTDLAQSDLLTLKRGETPSPSRLRDILVQANGTPQEYLVGRLVLRSMMQARYSPEAGEHFGLASPCYCHFTSPIRRYADLLVHRALSFTLGATPGPILAGHKLLMAADQCNARERAATEAEREIARRLGCLLLRERTGETFTGVVSGVTEFGFFVEFDEMPVEGMVRLTTFRDDWFGVRSGPSGTHRRGYGAALPSGAGRHRAADRRAYRTA